MDEELLNVWISAQFVPPLTNSERNAMFFCFLPFKIKVNKFRKRPEIYDEKHDCRQNSTWRCKRQRIENRKQKTL